MSDAKTVRVDIMLTCGRLLEVEAEVPGHDSPAVPDACEALRQQGFLVAFVLVGGKRNYSEIYHQGIAAVIDPKDSGVIVGRPAIILPRAGNA